MSQPICLLPSVIVSRLCVVVLKMDVEVKNNGIVVVVVVVVVSHVKPDVSALGIGSGSGVVLTLGGRLATVGDWEAWVNCEACAREGDGCATVVGVHWCRSVGSGAIVKGVEVGTSGGADGEVEVKKSGE